MDSILLTVKNSLGVNADYTGFDNEIITSINTAIMELNQLGIGPPEGLIITSADDHWHLLIGTYANLEAIKTYIGLKVRLLYDPPTSSSLYDALNRQVSELGWRLALQMELNSSTIS